MNFNWDAHIDQKPFHTHSFYQFSLIGSLTHITLPSFGILECSTRQMKHQNSEPHCTGQSLFRHKDKFGRWRSRGGGWGEGEETEWREGSEEGGTKRVRNWEDYVAKVKVDWVSREGGWSRRYAFIIHSQAVVCISVWGSGVMYNVCVRRMACVGETMRVVCGSKKCVMNAS